MKKHITYIVAALAAVTVFTGCGTAPLKGGKATTINKPAGVIEQTVIQSENPAQVSKQTQETVKTKTYTVPAGSSMVETHVVAPAVAGAAPLTNATALVISAPMFVTEHDETHAATELGAAQKDTARELSAKLASLKGIVELLELPTKDAQTGKGEVVRIVRHHNMVGCENSRLGDVVEVGRAIQENVIVIEVRQHVPEAGAKAMERVWSDGELNIQQVDCAGQQV